MENHRAFHLRGQHTQPGFECLEWAEPIVHSPGSVDCSMNRTDLLTYFGHRGAHPIMVGDIGGNDVDNSTSRFTGAELTDFLTDGILLLVRAQPLVPFILGRQWSAADENQ